MILSRLSPRVRTLAPPCVSLVMLFMLGACPDDSAGTSSEVSATDASSTDEASTGSSADASGSSTNAPTTTGTVMTDSTTNPDDSTTSTGSSTSGEEDSTTTGSTSSTGSTTNASDMCGDEIKDPGEECDLGDPMNGKGSYGGCNDDCTLQPHCNDGKHQPLDEECDPSDPLFAEAAVCTDVCTWKGVIVFLTSEGVSGDLGGVDGADAVCRSFAQEAGLQKWDQYHAWLSVGASPAANRVPLVDRPYYRLDGLKIAENSGELLSSKLLLPANISELKEDLGFRPVWTNSLPDGTTTSEMHDCQSFSSADFGDEAYVGFANKTDAQWTHAEVTSSCDLDARLYCFSPAF